jgi:rRNA-processing protein EBP2
MLAALQAHSRAMFGLDGPDEAESSTQAQQRASASSDEDDDGDEFQSDDGWGAEDDFVSDSEDGLDGDMPSIGQAKQAPAAAKVEEVVFTPAGRSNLDVMSKAEKRAFLVSHIAQQTVSIC